MAAALLSYNSSDANHHISRLALNLLSILIHIIGLDIYFSILVIIFMIMF